MKIEMKGLSKQYGNKKALDDVSLSLEEGVYALLGPNGAGKSTLINLLTDNVKRDHGEILVDGEDILSMGKKFRGMLGYMPQQQGVYDNYTAIGFLKYMASVKGLKRREAKAQIEHLLKVVNLYDVRNKKVGGFSGGMKQRVLLAQALLGNPKVLILDEPTAGLDPKERINIRNYIAELAQNMIILFATHVVSDIECISRKVILLKDGKVQGEGDPLELICGLQGKVGEVVCEYKDIEQYQKNYCTGNVNQSQEGMVLRVVGDTLPPEAKIVESNINLEDVYLYYLGY